MKESVFSNNIMKIGIVMVADYHGFLYMDIYLIAVKS